MRGGQFLVVECSKTDNLEIKNVALKLTTKKYWSKYKNIPGYLIITISYLEKKGLQGLLSSDYRVSLQYGRGTVFLDSVCYIVSSWFLTISILLRVNLIEANRKKCKLSQDFKI
jgi:hypothetical protein